MEVSVKARGDLKRENDLKDIVIFNLYLKKKLLKCENKIKGSIIFYRMLY